MHPGAAIMVAKAGIRGGGVTADAKHIRVIIPTPVFPCDEITGNADKIRLLLKAYADGPAQVAQTNSPRNGRILLSVLEMGTECRFTSSHPLSHRRM